MLSRRVASSLQFMGLCLRPRLSLSPSLSLSSPLRWRPFTFQRHWHSALLTHSFLSSPSVQCSAAAVQRRKRRGRHYVLCSAFSPRRTNRKREKPSFEVKQTLHCGVTRHNDNFLRTRFIVATVLPRSWALPFAQCERAPLHTPLDRLLRRVVRERTATAPAVSVAVIGGYRHRG